MKAREGFVSNSSSSSFVVVGFSFTREALSDEIMNSLWKERNIRMLHGSEDGVGEDELVIGHEIARVDSDDWGITSEQITMSEMLEKIENIKKIINKHNLEIKTEPVFYKGTRGC